MIFRAGRTFSDGGGLATDLGKAFAVKSYVHDIYEYPSLEQLTQAMLQRRESKPRRQDGDPTRALQDDVFLPPCITINPAFDTRQISAPRAILLTGATGFVGAHLLAELLRTTDAALYCWCATARNAADAAAGSGAAALPDRAERQPARAHSYRARNVAEHDFSLTPAAYRALSQDIDWFTIRPAR